MFVTEIRPLNKKKSRILFDDGEDLVLYNREIRASRIKEQEELPDEVYEKLAGEVLTKGPNTARCICCSDRCGRKRAGR